MFICTSNWDFFFPIVSNNSLIIILKLLFCLRCVTFPPIWQRSAQDVGCTAVWFFLLWVVAAPSNIFPLNKVGVGVPGVCSTKGRIFFLALPPHFFLGGGGCGEVPSAAITTTVELGGLLLPLCRCRRQNLWLLAPGDVWLLLLDEHFPLLQWLHWAVPSLSGPSRSEHRSGTVWNPEPCNIVWPWQVSIFLRSL